MDDPSPPRDIERDATIVAGASAYRPRTREDRAKGPAEGEALYGVGVRCGDGTVARYGTDVYLHWRSRPVKLRFLLQPPRLHSGRLIYGGVIGAEFGHQITQSIGRLWACEEFPEAEVVFPARLQGFPDLPGYFVELIRLLGIRNPVRLLSDPVKVTELVVPKDLCNLHRRPSIDPAFADWLASRRPDRSLDPGLSLYVSRSSLDHDMGQYLQEKLLEAALAAEGYRIVTPEQMTLPDQVELYLTASRLIFADGSAVHLWSLFGHPGQRAALVQRRRPDRHIRNWFRGLPGLDLTSFDRRVADFSRRGGAPGKGAALLDLRQLWQDLRAAGFHASRSELGPPRADLDRWLAEIQAGASALDAVPFDLDDRSRSLIAIRPRVRPSETDQPA